MTRNSLRAIVLCLTVLSISIAVFGQAPDRPNRPVPRLTSDDLPTPASQPAEVELNTITPDRPSLRPAAESTSGIVWQKDPREAARLAGSSNKLIIVDVFTDWCGWCKKMDREIYTDSRIAALSRSDVFLKLNAEDRGAGEEFARLAGVDGYPTTIVLDSGGRVLASQSGFIGSPEAFLQFVNRARAGRQNN